MMDGNKVFTMSLGILVRNIPGAEPVSERTNLEFISFSVLTCTLIKDVMKVAIFWVSIGC